MKTLAAIPVPFLSIALASFAYATELDNLNVLYIGDQGSPRANQFTGFLKKNVGTLETAARREFKPSEADAFDVVVLDWPQSELARENRKGNSPLGGRDQWNKPTVLLGSAGLNLAVAWKVRGGSG